DQRLDGIGVVLQQLALAAADAIETVLVLDDMAQPEHAQAHAYRVVEVAPRHVDARPGPLEVADEIVYRRFQRELRVCGGGAADEHRRDERDRQDRDHARNRFHDYLADALYRAAPLDIVQRPEIDAVLDGVSAHRDGSAEIDARVTEAIPPARRH